MCNSGFATTHVVVSVRYPHLSIFSPPTNLPKYVEDSYWSSETRENTNYSWAIEWFRMKTSEWLDAIEGGVHREF